MDLSFQTFIAIQIVLPEDITATKSTPPPAVRYSGDDISGHLVVLTRGDFHFEINLSFEGVARTWLGSDYSNLQKAPFTAEFQFLQEIQNVFSVPQVGRREDSYRIYRLPFRFVVPHNLISARSNVRPEFLKLRPSTEVGQSYRGPISGKLYGQPLIAYAIRVNRIKTGLAVPRSMKYYSEREIILLPYKSPDPPIGIECFPSDDYKSTSRRIIRQHMWGRPLGSLEITATEPPPLNVLTSAPKPCTFPQVKLEFKPQPASGIDTCPTGWKCVVKHHIRSRTFWSTKALEQLPTSSTAKLDPFVAMRDQKTLAETREYSSLRWKRGRYHAQSKLSGDDTSQPCSWETALILPISALGALLPTFLGPLSARQYAVVMRLEIKGMFRSPLELALPLQVIHYPAARPEEHGEEGTMTQESILSAAADPSDQLPLFQNDVRSTMRVRHASPPPYDDG